MATAIRINGLLPENSSSNTTGNANSLTCEFISLTLLTSLTIDKLYKYLSFSPQVIVVKKN